MFDVWGRVLLTRLHLTLYEPPHAIDNMTISDVMSDEPLEITPSKLPSVV